jgi:hypothetical protein
MSSNPASAEDGACCCSANIREAAPQPSAAHGTAAKSANPVPSQHFIAASSARWRSDTNLTPAPSCCL